jgi:hypothetical protein
MKKILIVALFAPLAALAQTLPSPTFNSITLQNPLSVSSGGSGATSSTGTGSLVLSNSPTLVTPALGTPSAVTLTNGAGLPISTGVSGLGAGVAAGLANAATGTGGVVLSSAPTITSPTVTGAFTAIGLVTTADLAAQTANTVLANATSSTASPTAVSVPSCSSAGSALNWTSGSGFGCVSFGSTPTASTNAALQATSTASSSVVWRLGFSALGDVPPLLYSASASSCSLNSGNGDNGSQVKSADGKCWIASFPAGPVNVKEFGAKGDGTTNDTAAMQSAHNTGHVVYYPQSTGAYIFTTLTMTAGGIIGDGESYSMLSTADTTTANDITFNAVNLQPGFNAPVFRGFSLLSTAGSSKTAGAGIAITAPTDENQGGRFENVQINGFPIDLHFIRAAYWTITNCNFINYYVAGVQVENQNNPDSGDSTIMGSVFVTSVGSTPAGILYNSSGGLKIIGNKILAGGTGIDLELNAPASTSIFVISGNSIENQTGFNIHLARQSGSATFSKIEITGNEFNVGPFGIASDSSGAISVMSITGNSFTGGTTTVADIALTNFSDATISSNNFVNNGSASAFAINLSSVTNGKVGKNSYSGFATSNDVGITGGTVYVDRDRQLMTMTVTTSTAYGPLFSGGTVVTFPHSYNSTPEVSCFPIGGGGGVSAFAESVTTTGFTAGAVGATSSGAVGVTCFSDGIL